jgi:hypothetical protein
MSDVSYALRLLSGVYQPVDEPTRTEITAIETKDDWSLKASRLFPYLEMSFDGFFELYDRIFYGQPYQGNN